MSGALAALIDLVLAWMVLSGLLYLAAVFSGGLPGGYELALVYLLVLGFVTVRAVRRSRRRPRAEPRAGGGRAGL